MTTERPPHPIDLIEGMQQKAAHEALDHHQVMIGDLHLMLLSMVQVTHYLGMVLVVTVDITVIHPKMAIQSQDQILAVDGHQIGCLPYKCTPLTTTTPEVLPRKMFAYFVLSLEHEYEAYKIVVYLGVTWALLLLSKASHGLSSLLLQERYNYGKCMMQLTIYNHNDGPCFRCLFPTPPPRAACQSCADDGVLGVVPGIIGCLQALEAIKIATSVGEPLSGRMLLFDALAARIRIVKIRGRSLQCEACGENAIMNQQYFREFDYEKFTQTPLSEAPLKLNLLPSESRISSKVYSEIILNKEPHVLVDVRPTHHFKIVSLPNSVNIPFADIEFRLPEISSILKKDEEEKSAELYVVCRRGNDSQRAVQYLHKTRR